MSSEILIPEVIGPGVPPMPDGPDGKPMRTWTMQLWQRRAHFASERFIVIPAGRRIGKSEFGVMWALEQYRRNRILGKKGVIWIVYPSYAIARVAWRKFRRLAPRGWVRQYMGTEMHPQAIILVGGISIEFKSGVNPGALVGEGLLAAWIDECGEVRERVWTESLRPTLADHIAPALMTGTPKGRNWFWRMYTRGWDPEFPAICPIGVNQGQGLSTYRNPYIKREEVDDLAKDMSERLFGQEILAKFLSSEGAVFKLERAKAKGLCYSTERTVAMGLDIARRQDWTVITGMDRDLRVTYWERFRDIDWPFQRQRVEAAWLKLDKPAIVCDSTGVGDEFVQELQYTNKLPVVPYLFTVLSKRQLVETIAVALDKANETALTLPDEPILLNELEAFDMKQLPSGNIRYSAPEGQHDDAVMSYGLAIHGAVRYGDIGISVGGIA